MTRRVRPPARPAPDAAPERPEVRPVLLVAPDGRLWARCELESTPGATTSAIVTLETGVAVRVATVGASDIGDRRTVYLAHTLAELRACAAKGVE